MLKPKVAANNICKSGNPPVAATTLAPTESGSQLLRLPEPEFESRCLKTNGVSPEQAKAFRSKFWQIHVDSQKDTSGDSNTTGDTILKRFASFGQSSSRDPNPKAVDIPFTDRIRSGMVVSWDAPEKLQYGRAGSVNMVVILSPTTAFPSDSAHVVSGAEEVDASESETYLCALVSPGVMPDSYTLDLWRHAVVKKSQMKAEVILEFDSATRYYHIAI